MKRHIAVRITTLLAISLVVGAMSVVTAKASGRVNPSVRESVSSITQATRATVERLQLPSSQSPAGQGQAGDQLPDSPIYVSLGDSVAAGAGLTPLPAATKVDETCDRSSESYPYQVAIALQSTVTQLACSGAKVDEGIYGRQARQGVRIPAQLDIAFAAQKPDIITATIGANDARWTQFIRQCYVTRCGTRFDEARAKVYRADLRIELTRMLGQIQIEGAGKPAQVYIGGYYDPLVNLDCITSNRITAEELVWLKAQTASLNQAIQSVTPLFSFVTYVPIDFTGHELCSDEPWVQGMEAAAPIHPTATGQSAIAQAFVRSMQTQ